MQTDDTDANKISCQENTTSTPCSRPTLQTSSNFVQGSAANFPPQSAQKTAILQEKMQQQQQREPQRPKRDFFTPTLQDICAAQWTTLPYIPPDVRDEWTSIFEECIYNFNVRPSTATLTMLFLCSKGLLASVRHGGKARLEAVNRTLRNRIRLWRAGCFGELWDRLLKDHTTRTPA